MSSKANERHSNKPKLSMAFFAVSKQVSSSGCNQANRMCEGFRLDHDWITIDKDWQKTALYSLLKALTCEKPGERGQKNRVEVTSCIATAHRRQTREPRNCARARNVPVTKTAFLAARRTSFFPRCASHNFGGLLPACPSRAHRFLLVDPATQRITGFPTCDPWASMRTLHAAAWQHHRSHFSAPCRAPRGLILVCPVCTQQYSAVLSN